MVTVQDAIREMTAGQFGIMRTHSESCWQWHLPCAALLAAAMLDDLESERDDDADD